MLTPEELTSIVESMYPYIDELNDWIVKDIIKSVMARLNRGEALSISETNKWQMTVLQATGHHYEDLQAEMQNFTRRSQKEIQQIFEDAGIRSWEADEDFYQSQGFEPRQLITNKRILDILQDSYKRTNGEIRNLTRTTALMSQRNLETVLDKAHMKVMTGAQSYSAAYREAVNELVGYQAEVLYPSGHKDTVETAVLRCIRTGTAQATGNMTLDNMIQHDWDLIRVSAHLGARYGDGGENPSNHFWWQGKLYSRTGKDPKYPDFKSTTGYGTGEGLCGWNCRHSYGPGDPDHNPFKDYDAEENKRAYDLSQKQRAAERKIRHQKTKVLGLHEAMDNASSNNDWLECKENYEKESALLKKHNSQYNRLCEDNNLKKLSERITVQKWNRSEASKATQAVKSLENPPGKLYYKFNETLQHTTNVSFKATNKVPNLEAVVPKGVELSKVYVMAGRGTSTPIRDINRLKAEYDLKPSDWQKKSGTAYGNNFSYTIHWYENNGIIPIGEIKLKGVGKA